MFCIRFKGCPKKDFLDVYLQKPLDYKNFMGIVNILSLTIGTFVLNKNTDFRSKSNRF